ncbi:MAG: prepilin-type N-terminal cleavage/methylation domain-containing protein [bacterium]|jgi:prepilin-type N-terminal cleavage/methylation domain-containing protein
MLKSFAGKSGFTLIELLVVIVIIGLLLGTAVPAYNKVRTKARETQVVSNSRSIQVALEQFGTDHSGFYPLRLVWYANVGDREPVMEDQAPDWPPMGLAGGVRWVDENGALYDLETVRRNPLLPQDIRFMPQPRVGALVSQFHQYSDPLVVLGYLPGGYPKNPFLNRPMGVINWSWANGEPFTPGANVAVSSGDFVYTHFPCWDENLGQWEDPKGVVKGKVRYRVETEAGTLPGEWGVDLIDCYQLWSYGNLPITAAFYSAYDNSEFPGPPPRKVAIRQDWNANGKKDPFEAGIIFYASGGSCASERDQNTGGKIEF